MFTGGNLIIGLSQRILYHRGRAYDSIEHGWYSYLAGHTLFYLPNTPEQDFEHLARQLDLFIITGGDDTPLRRIAELKLAGAMMRQGQPVLGVCHGCFLLTHTLGGIVNNKEGHYDVEHTVTYRDQSHVVNSFHSNYIFKLHESADCLAVDPEGHCEAWIDGTMSGVAWHPERMDRPWLPDEIHNLLFKDKK